MSAVGQIEAAKYSGSLSLLGSEDYLLGIRRVFTSSDHSLWRTSLTEAESSCDASLWPDGLYLWLLLVAVVVVAAKAKAAFAHMQEQAAWGDLLTFLYGCSFACVHTAIRSYAIPQANSVLRTEDASKC